MFYDVLHIFDKICYRGFPRKRDHLHFVDIFHLHYKVKKIDMYMHFWYFILKVINQNFSKENQLLVQHLPSKVKYSSLNNLCFSWDDAFDFLSPRMTDVLVEKFPNPNTLILLNDGINVQYVVQPCVACYGRTTRPIFVNSQ